MLRTCSSPPKPPSFLTATTITAVHVTTITIHSHHTTLAFTGIAITTKKIATTVAIPHFLLPFSLALPPHSFFPLVSEGIIRDAAMKADIPYQ
jgi:hypothetical protein